MNVASRHTARLALMGTCLWDTTLARRRFRRACPILVRGSNARSVPLLGDILGTHRKRSPVFASVRRTGRADLGRFAQPQAPE